MAPTAEDEAALPSQLFELGRLATTPAAHQRMWRAGIKPYKLLARHHAGDWGDVDPAGAVLNDEALRTGARLPPVYGTDDGGLDRRIWIVTEADRSLTMLGLPWEFAGLRAR